MQSGGGAQTAEQLVLEAWNGADSVVVRNVGTRTVNVAQIYVNGISEGLTTAVPIGVGTATTNPHTFALTAGSFSAGSNIVKLVSTDGAVFVFTVVLGQAS